MNGNTKMKSIGILIERQRGYGRRLCEGIVRFACTKDDWTLKFIEFDELRQAVRKNSYDGFIARVMNGGIAKVLASTGKPVVDVFFEKPVPGFAVADQHALAVGQMAARHFIEHHFSNFAFCGYDGRSYSDGRRKGFVRSLELNHFKCSLYSTPEIALKDFDNSVVMHERFAMPSDAGLLLEWLVGLPKPVALFCAHDMRAYHVSEICRANGIRVPGEVAILGVDNDELVCQFTDPPISSIDQNPVGIGYAAAESLQKMFDNPRVVPPPVSVKPLGLVERGSTRIYPLSPPWLSDALVFIRSSISKNITASDVYAHVGKSHTLVDKTFRRQLDTTVQKEISKTRLAEAKRLVQTTSMPLKSIAKATGFSSLQYFSTSFAKAFGAHPSSFR